LRYGVLQRVVENGELLQPYLFRSPRFLAFDRGRRSSRVKPRFAQGFVDFT